MVRFCNGFIILNFLRNIFGYNHSTITKVTVIQSVEFLADLDSVLNYFFLSQTVDIIC